VIIGLWLGAMLMLGGNVALSVFSVADQQTGGRIMQRIFPFYYALSLICPAAALALVFRAAGRAGRRRAMLAPLGLSVLVAAWNAFVLGPRIAAVRALMHAPGGMEQTALVESFGRLHRHSVVAMGVLVALALAYVLLEILAPPEPRPGPD